MINIKLPGSKKTKKILLAILVVVSIIIICKFAIDNKKESQVDKENKEVSEVINKDENNKDELEVSETDRNNKKETIELPTNPEEESMYNEAFNTFFAGDYNKAIALADNIISKYPDSYKAYSIRGLAKGFVLGFDEAMKDIDKSLEINPNYWYSRYNKAFTYELYDKFNEALEWYDKSLELKEYKWSYYGKASIYGRWGDVTNTVLYLQKAIDAEKADGYEGPSQIKEEAKDEKDFNPVRGYEAFENVIK